MYQHYDGVHMVLRSPKCMFLTREHAREGERERVMANPKGMNEVEPKGGSLYRGMGRGGGAKPPSLHALQPPTTRKQAISGASVFAISGALVVRHYYHATTNF
jgi:hypothetical protein